MDFIAIDFETANQRADSACQIGISVVSNSRIVETQSWLLKPPYGGFSPFNIMVHGITPADVEHEPTFGDLWGTIKPYFTQSNLLIAHNAGFDVNVLFNTLKCFELAVPELTVACSIAMARRAWYNEPSYSLGTLANKFGIQFMHHDAGEDARACAEIALRVFEVHNITQCELNADTVDGIAEQLDIYFGYIDDRGYANCHCRSKRSKSKKRS